MTPHLYFRSVGHYSNFQIYAIWNYERLGKSSQFTFMTRSLILSSLNIMISMIISLLLFVECVVVFATRKGTEVNERFIRPALNSTPQDPRNQQSAGYLLVRVTERNNKSQVTLHPSIYSILSERFVLMKLSESRTTKIYYIALFQFGN